MPIATKLNAAKKVLRKMSDDKTLKHLKNSTNSGLPYYKRKGLVKDNLIKDRSKLHDLMTKGLTPCVLFTRTQEQDKTRNIWGYPILQTFIEMALYQPWLEVEKRFPWRSALGGPEKVDQSIQDLFKRIKDGETFISIDFSSYDASINYQLINLAFEFISNFFQSECQDDLRSISHTTSSIGILTPDDRMN